MVLLLMRGKPMKHDLLISVIASFLALVFVSNSQAQAMYKCDNNYYTNTLPDAKAKGCKLLEGGNVTVVQGTRPAASAPARSAAAASNALGTARVDAGEQKSRDSDSRQILEFELKKAEARQIELHKEYNNGEPEKRGDEARNYQKYLDRLAELKASLARNESDIAGIRRELGRLNGSAAK
jgi:hypothetical protein